MPTHTHSLDRRINPDAGAFDNGNTYIGNSCASTTDRQIMGTFNTYSSGSGAWHNIMQPFIVLSYLIKYSSNCYEIYNIIDK